MSSSTPPAQRSEPRGGLDRFFSITRRGSTVGREVRGGVATFIAMSYIVVLNPLVLGYGPDGAGNALGGERVAAMTALVAGVLTILMGVGIGLFIALIGFVNAGFVRRIPDAAHTTVPVQLGTGGELFGWPTLTFVVGLLLTVALMVRNVRGGILISVVLTTVLAHVLEAVSPSGSSVDNPHGWSLVVPSSPEALFAVPDLSLLGSAAPIDAFRELGGIACALLIFTILLSIFFDAMGTMVGLSRQAGLEDADGQIENVDRVLLVDALGAVAGGAGSVSSNQIFVESSTGIADGARTGLANVVTGVLFLAAMFLTPLVNVVPFEAVAPAMVVVGFLMARNVVAIDWADLGVAIPAFLTFAVMPFTYSIANGIGAGFVSYVFIRLVQGRAKDVHPLMYVVALAFVAFFGIGVIEGWAG